MGKYTEAKNVVRRYYEALEAAPAQEVGAVLSQYMSADYAFQGSYPFRNLEGAQTVGDTYWKPLKTALSSMQRRLDIFIGGTNEFNDETWVMGMGHFVGLFDADFLGIRHTRKMISLRFAEFSCVCDGKITKTGLFVDYIGMMQQAGANPLPPSTAQYYVYPGPRSHDGLLYEDAPEHEAEQTLGVVQQMVDDLDRINKSGSNEPPTAEELGRSWCQDMIWYGPAGIGATYTIPRYIQQHTGPFRGGLGDKVFVGHQVRFAEGKFACFFGWPNLRNRNIGGYLGMCSGDTVAEMQVVDVYCARDGKLFENWVIIDLPWWFKQQGLDVFQRTQTILNPVDENN